MYTLSVIICTFNRSALLSRCIDALADQMSRHVASTEVIVVDNNSKDDTWRVLTEYSTRYAWMRCVQETEQGLSYARNRGAETAQGTYLGYLDDDGMPGPDYLDAVHAVIVDHAPDIFGGPIYPYYTSQKPGWFSDDFEIRRHADKSGFAQCSISGGNFFIRAALLRELGGFSTELGMVGNKVRLGEERAILEKYRRTRPREQHKVYYSLECFIYHHVPNEKMRVSYLLKRGYFSGRSSVIVKQEHHRNILGLIRKLCGTLFLEAPRSFVKGRAERVKLIGTLQRSAILTGKISQHLENLATNRGSERAAGE